jgi:hypothetical protein
LTEVRPPPGLEEEKEEREAGSLLVGVSEALRIMGWLVGRGERPEEPKLASKLTSEPELPAEEHSREERLLDMQEEVPTAVPPPLRGLW